MRRLEFWYDFASTYSYLSATRIEALAAAGPVEVIWRPFLLGPIFRAQGWETSPFKLYPAKGRYMIRDVARRAAARGKDFHMPLHWPASSVKAARMALVGAREGWIAAFTRAVFEAEFEAGRDIADDAALGNVCGRLGLDFARLSSLVAGGDIKSALKAQTDRAQALGIFGAPSFVAEDGEVFWGDDRLEQALAWPRAL
jgi:2-hydroxychromene-2-carboxylate isomerase